MNDSPTKQYFPKGSSRAAPSQGDFIPSVSLSSYFSSYSSSPLYHLVSHLTLLHPHLHYNDLTSLIHISTFLTASHVPTIPNDLPAYLFGFLNTSFLISKIRIIQVSNSVCFLTIKPTLLLFSQYQHIYVLSPNSAVGLDALTLHPNVMIGCYIVPSPAPRHNQIKIWDSSKTLQTSH